LDELVEHDPVGDAGPVAAERVGDLAGGQQGGDLDPEGFQDRRWQGRHETSRGSQGVSPPRSSRLVPALLHPAYWRRPLANTSSWGGWGRSNTTPPTSQNPSNHTPASQVR